MTVSKSPNTKNEALNDRMESHSMVITLVYEARTVGTVKSELERFFITRSLEKSRYSVNSVICENNKPSLSCRIADWGYSK